MKPRSLRWMIVWPLTALQAVVMIMVTIGLYFHLMTQFSSSRPVDGSALAEIANSIQSDAAGNLRIVNTPALTQLETESPGLWFVARNAVGREIRHGDVPGGLREIAAQLDDIQDADIRGPDGSHLTMRIERATSPAGELRIMYGGRERQESFAIDLLGDLKVVYLPFLAFTLLAAFLSVPILVRQSLRGLRRTTEIAAGIDVNGHGKRLPVDGVPEEVLPLVTSINAALARLDSGYAQRQRFLADAAHELRTPIAILQTNLEAMPPSSQQQKLLNDVGRLANTAEQLLDLHRIDQGYAMTQEVDLVEICKTVTADLAPSAIAAGYEISFSSDTDRLLKRGDNGSLERAVTNLVRNAIEHGGGSGTIRITVSRPGVVEVTDEGPGIPESHRSEVFEPFYRVAPKNSGAGLGLNLVKQIVQRHGGDVSIIPQSKGAKFRISL